MAWNPIEYLNANYDTDKNGLIARKGFADLTAEQKKAICNGMGSQATWWNRLLYHLIPNNFFGLDMTIIGDRHDYDYVQGGAAWWMKVFADTVFFINMLIWIWQSGKNHRKKRLWMAFQYYLAVLAGGKSSYNYHEVAP